jgi:hypothetical protein
MRQRMLTPQMVPALREYLLVDEDCISVLSAEPPEIHDVGADPEHPVAE